MKNKHAVSQTHIQNNFDFLSVFGLKLNNKCWRLLVAPEIAKKNGPGTDFGAIIPILAQFWTYRELQKPRKNALNACPKMT